MDVTLPDEYVCMVDRLCKALFVNHGLQIALKQILGGKLKDLIKFKLVIGKDSISEHASKKSHTLKDMFWVLGVKSQQHMGSLTKLWQSMLLNTLNLMLVPKTILTEKLQLGIQMLLFVRIMECLESVTAYVLGTFHVN
eukprot:15366376-Ditylum_brightwellii.AAC.1